ncbi:glycosyltransferase family A protein [Novosphingobium sp. PASSN1]|uniref:glycosyltransferase family 2 protein n=1 Tax=Novosphingobium sp. PASSN1 TaxID=2015561 RepID=UPI0025CDD531|nr:glycosyltransferase family A protein [Novosphingobium sp. PASSN1]
MASITSKTDAFDAGQCLFSFINESTWLTDNYTPDLVSIIIPTYNRSILLMDLLAALSVQTHKLIELVIVDDGSTDDTDHRLRAWVAAQTIPVRIFRQDNAGPAAARNLGLQQARGEYLYFIDSDDLIFPTALEELVAALSQSGRSYCLGGIRNADVKGSPLPLDWEGIPCVDPDTVLRSRWMIHAALYHRSAIRRAGPFGHALGIGEDSEFHWRIVATNGAGHILHKFIGLRRIHDQGHLSVNRSWLDVYRQTSEVLFHFAGWMLARGALDKGTARFLIRSIVISSLKLGTLDDRTQVPAARAVILRLRVHSRLAAQAGLLLIAPRAKSFYWIAVSVLLALRAVRNGLNWLRGFAQQSDWAAI